MAKKYIVIPDDPSERRPAAHDDGSRTANTFKDFCTLKDVFFQIDRASFVPKTKINFSLFSQEPLGFKALIRADDKSPVVLNEEALSAIYRNESEVLIRKSDFESYFAYLSWAADHPGLSEDEKLRRQSIIIKESAKISMKDFLDDPRSGEKLTRVKNTVINIADSLLENRDVIYTMLTLHRYDHYLYTHCVNVGVLSLALGISIGLSVNDFKKLGVGAMIHDIGMTAIPAEIRNKQGKLSDFEYNLIKEHVREGEKAVKENTEIPREAFFAVSQHHEKKSGMGYPYRLKGDEINLFGKITGIADCYDALTTQRPHRKAYNPFEALKMISEEKQNYDLGLLSQFIKMLGKIR